MINVSIHLYYENSDKIVFIGHVNNKNDVTYCSVDNIVTVQCIDGSTFYLEAASNASVGIFIDSGKEGSK